MGWRDWVPRMMPGSRAPLEPFTGGRAPVETLEQRQARARAARGLLENEVLAEALERMDKRALTRWRAAIAQPAREECWHAVQAIAAFRAELQGVINEGLQ